MRALFDEYGLSILAVIVGAVVIISVLALMLDDDIYRQSGLVAYRQESGIAVDRDDDRSRIVKFECWGALLYRGTAFNPYDYCEAFNDRGESLQEYIKVTGFVDTATIGEYIVRYELHYDEKNYGQNVIFFVGERSGEDEDDV